MLFEIDAVHYETGDKKTLTYDNITNTLTVDGVVLENGESQKADKVTPFSKDAPLTKSSDVRLLKIQLGMSCNYSCDYCSQRFVERPKETSKKDIEDFMQKLDNLNFDEQRGLKIEFWGGEPFVYWKTLRPLFEAIKEKFSTWVVPPSYSVITNGSILTPEICDWLYDNGFSMAISHDGPGQHIRGPDPFEDSEYKAFVLKFYRRMRREGRISFNAMLNKHNISRKAIHDWFIDFTGDINVPLGEGNMIDAYDADGIKNSLETKAEHFKYRQTAFNDIRANDGYIGFSQIVERVDEFTRRVLSHRHADTVGQKCGMDREDVIAVDLRGDVLTCQTVSTVEVAMNGELHRAGNITDLANVQVKTATHWSNREHCSSCPVVHICKGSCMYLEGDAWDASCGNAYSDGIAIFSLSLEKMTNGYIPVLIKNTHLPDDRRDIWGTILEHKETKRKTFPIKVVSTKTMELNGVQVYTSPKEVTHE